MSILSLSPDCFLIWPSFACLFCCEVHLKQLQHKSHCHLLITISSLLVYQFCYISILQFHLSTDCYTSAWLPKYEIDMWLWTLFSIWVSRLFKTLGDVQDEVRGGGSEQQRQQSVQEGRSLRQVWRWFLVTAIVKVKCNCSKCKKIALHSVKTYIWSSLEHFKLRAKQFLQN